MSLAKEVKRAISLRIDSYSLAYLDMIYHR